MLLFLEYYARYVMRDAAQPAVSSIGSGAMLASIAALKKYFWNPESVVRRRFRRGKCTTCGYSVHPDQVYCPDCGAQLHKTCPDCQSQTPVEGKYCMICGEQQS